jgi:hypothetical protein
MAYSQDTFQISKDDIREVVTRSRSAGLNAEEERIIEDTIIRVRGSNERISLFEIDHALQDLEIKQTISKFDRRHVMEAFEAYSSPSE